MAPQASSNATVTDVEGREFIDFAGGIAVLNTGHLHPKIIAAVQEQLTKLTHTCFQVLAYEPYVELCEKINAKVPGNFDKKTLLVTTGSEAVENAVKIARAAPGRRFSDGYLRRQYRRRVSAGRGHVDFILPKLDDKSIVGVGTGSTANCFIDALALHKGAFDGAVASSSAP